MKEIKRHSKYILVNPISDHFPLYCTLKLKYTSKKSQPLYIRNFSKLNNDQLLSQTTQQLSNLLNNFIETPSEDIHQQFQKLSDTLKTIVNNNIPLEKLSRKKTKLKEKPWLTKEILNEIKIKNKMFKKLKKGKILDPDLEKKYKEHRNKLTHAIHKAKQKHYQKLLCNSANDSKKTWNVINDVMKKNKKQ